MLIPLIFESAYFKCRNKLSVAITAPEASDIFNVHPQNFVALARQCHAWQRQHCVAYRQYLQQLPHAAPAPVHITDMVPLPISFFKTAEVYAADTEPDIVFTSSGTTGMQTSRHQVAQLAWYEQSFLTALRLAYGAPEAMAWLCLLPSYMERSGSSLIYMAQHLVQHSMHRQSGFFLKADDALLAAIESCRQAGIPTVLLGVSFALLDFAERHPGLDLSFLTIMETGGMKGRRREPTRAELHATLCDAFGSRTIHSEYGMTELLSQAYSKGEGLYEPPPWMWVLVRSEEDPFAMSETGTGILCIIDLANVYSCSFIETQDVGRVHADGRFEVLGRLDNSDIRGCSLLAL